MHFAIFNRIKMIELLLAVPGIDVNAKDDFNESALFIAVQNRYFDIAELLLSHGAVVDTSDDLLQYFNKIGRWITLSDLIQFLSLLLAHQSSPQQYYETMILPLVSAGQRHHHLQPQVADMMREINWQTRKHFLGFLDINSSTIGEEQEQEESAVADMLSELSRSVVEYI
jgi:ankyrin repeat protein